MGWVLGGTAERMAVERVNARHDRRSHTLLRRELHAAAQRGLEARRVLQDRLLEAGAVRRRGGLGEPLTASRVVSGLPGDRM